MSGFDDPEHDEACRVRDLENEVIALRAQLAAADALAQAVEARGFSVHDSVCDALAAYRAARGAK